MEGFEQKSDATSVRIHFKEVQCLTQYREHSHTLLLICFSERLLEIVNTSFDGICVVLILWKYKSLENAYL